MSTRESPAGSGSHHSPAANDKSPSPARSRSREYSRSRSPAHRSHHSHSDSRKMYRNRYKSRSRSHSPGKRYKSSRYSRSRSRSTSPRNGGGRYSSYGRRSYHRSHSRSPMSSRRRHVGNREAPPSNRCLGVFGLSLRTTERDLREVFSRFGPIEEVVIVVDAQTGRSRGFSFVYFESMEDAKVAKEQCTGMEIDGRRIRVDYSITQRAHTPTPGIYMGKPTEESASRGYRGGGGYRRSPSPYYRKKSRYERSRSRSYSPARKYYY